MASSATMASVARGVAPATAAVQKQGACPAAPLRSAFGGQSLSHGSKTAQAVSSIWLCGAGARSARWRCLWVSPLTMRHSHLTYRLP